MHCYQCNGWISVTDTYCPSCGVKILSVTERLMDTTQTQQQTFIHRHVKKMAWFVVLAGLISIFTYFYWFSSYSLLGERIKPDTGNRNSSSLNSETASEQIQEKLSQHVKPFLQPQEAQVQKACMDDVISLREQNSPSFPYEEKTQIRLINKQEKRWRLEGYFEQQENGKQVKHRYICYVQISDKKIGVEKSGTAIVIY